MTLLDRYLLKNYFINLLFWCLCIIGIFVVFDLFTNLDALVAAGKKAGNVPKIIAAYYFFKSVPLAMMLCSVLGLISAMITVAMMMRNNELVPVQAAGISTLRIIRPLILATLFVAGAATVLREIVLPNYLPQLVMEAGNMSEDSGSVLNAAIDNETGIGIHGEKMFQGEKRISKPNFTLPKPLVKQLVRLDAENAYYQPASAEHPAGFLLVNIEEIPGVLNGEVLKFKDKQIVFTHKDSPAWVKPDECFIATNVPLGFLASNDAWRTYASTFDLIQAARNKSLDVGNSIHTLIHARLLEPFLDIALLFLGLPTILTYGGRNVFKPMGLSGLLVFSFLAVREGCRFLGANMEMPVLGAWLPLIVFGPIAVNQFMMLRMK
ncbi:MAG: LptF/LptG family permease [Planctomycetaceae bacterium]|jgi:lipopolysaccharide export system permease protein|nr:LptF/LptG family permease [Planctomycetaceae bacterium]